MAKKVTYTYEVALRFFDGVDGDYPIAKICSNSRNVAWRLGFEKLRKCKASAACGGFYIRIVSKGVTLCEYTKNNQGRIVRS